MDGPSSAADAPQYPDKLDIAAHVLRHLDKSRVEILDKLKVTRHSPSPPPRYNTLRTRSAYRQQNGSHEANVPRRPRARDSWDIGQGNSALEPLFLEAPRVNASNVNAPMLTALDLVALDSDALDLGTLLFIPTSHRDGLHYSVKAWVYLCICGQCSGRDCQSRLNLLYWTIRRSLRGDWIYNPFERMWQSRLQLGGLLASTIVDDEESSGLDFVESVLPFEQSTAGEQATCTSCKGLGSFISGLAASFEPSKLAISLYRVKAAATHCNFCKLLYAAGTELARPNLLYCFRSSRYELHLEAVECFLEIASMGGARSPSREIDDGQCVRMHFSPPPFPMQRDKADFMIFHPIALSAAGASFTSGRTVDENQIRLPVLKAWISECIASHGVMCNGFHLPNADGKLRSLRLVDVINYCVVRQPSSSRYVALSYVWGKASSLQLTRENESHLRKPGTLRSNISEIPQTFLDAFEVVKSIGERYIWIDALCITQDAEDKEAHLQDMHLVYGAALFTLVAGGDDANAGLHGVRPSSRSRIQIYERLRPEIGVAVSMPLPANLRSSRWSSRAWTYQEQLLSKRFLVFFDDQVLWQCPTVVQCEDTLADNKNAPYERLKHLSSSGLNEDDPSERAIQPGFQRPPAFQRYADIVSEYTGRELSFSEDVLQAFGGISKIFMLDMNTEMVEGLPISFLDAAILWQPSLPLRRRRGNERFSSWSWAGWEGKVLYEETKERQGAEGLLPIIKWNVHRTELVNRYGVGIKPYLFSPGIERTTWVSPFEPTATGSANLAQTSAQLKFWTSCSFFERLVGRGSTHRAVGTEQAVDYDPRRLRPREYQIRNARGQSIGVVTITGEDLQGYSPSRHEYIVLSEAQFAGIDMVAWQPRFSGEPGKCLMYNVMLIEWDEEKECAYRVGLGRIMKSAWTQSGPRNKYITLG